MISNCKLTGNLLFSQEASLPHSPQDTCHPFSSLARVTPASSLSAGGLASYLTEKMGITACVPICAALLPPGKLPCS